MGRGELAMRSPQVDALFTAFVDEKKTESIHPSCPTDPHLWAT